MKKLIYVIPVALIALIITKFFIFQSRSVSIKCASSYAVDCEWETTRRVMVRTNVMEKVVASCGAEIIDKKTTGITFATNRLINGNWIITATGEYKIKSNEPDFIVPVKVYSVVTPNTIDSEVVNSMPVKELTKYIERTHMRKDGSKTSIFSQIDMTVTFSAPPFKSFDEMVKKRMVDNAMNSLQKEKDVLIQELAKYKGRKVIFEIK